MAKRSKSAISVHQVVMAAALLVALLLAVWFVSYSNQSLDYRSKASELQNSFVTRQGTQFYLGSQQFKFVGFNLFDAAGSGTSPYSCPASNGWFPKYTDEEFDQALDGMKNETEATVLRFWAFQKYTKGGTDFSGIDKVIQKAKAKGFKVMPVLEDGPGYCTEPGGGGNAHLAKWQYQGDTWYTQGYKEVNSGYTLSYRDYVKKIVERYKDEPAVFGWMMVNEADTSQKLNGKSVLIGFALDIGTLIKSIDRNHLITVGTQSNGASGATGQDFIDVYGLDIIDFAEAHDWGYWGNDNEAIPGGVKNADGTMSPPNPLSADCLKQYQAKIGCSLAQAAQIVKKPFVIGEAGIAANTDSTRAKRAQLMDAKMKAFFDYGAAGYLYWQWNKIIDAQQYDVLLNTNDPLLPTMKKYAGLQLTGTTTPPTYPSNTPQPSTSVKVTPTPVPSVKPSSTPTPKPTIKPSASPTATPRPTIRPSASPTPKPTIKPSPLPTIKPTPFPSPAPSPITQGSAKLEGEAMSLLTGGKAVVMNDVSASGQQTLLITSNATAIGQIQGPVRKLVIRAKPQKCFGDPHINVKINGNYVLDTNVSADGYSEYTTQDISYMRLGNLAYKVEIIYNNDAFFGVCDRNLFIDSIVAQ